MWGSRSKIHEYADAIKRVALILSGVLPHVRRQPLCNKKPGLQLLRWRCLRDNICLLSPDTIEWLNHLIVSEGHRLAPEVAETVRGDSFVVKTDVHYPTDSSLIGDGLRTIIATARRLAGLLGQSGWRQYKHLLRSLKQQLRTINRTAASKGRDYRKRLRDAYRAVLEDRPTGSSLVAQLLDPACLPISPGPATRTIERLRAKLLDFVNMTIQACDQARRRVLAEESVPNAESLQRVRATDSVDQAWQGAPTRRVRPPRAGHRGWCRLRVPIRDPSARGRGQRRSVVEQMRQVQGRLGGRIRSALFDRGFHSPANQRGLAELVSQPCLATKGHVQAERQERAATVAFRRGRGGVIRVESAIGALQSGNGLERCRDRSFGGYCRYVGLGMLGRTLHVLGKLLIDREAPKSEAGRSRRGRSAA